MRATVPDYSRSRPLSEDGGITLPDGTVFCWIALTDAEGVWRTRLLSPSPIDEEQHAAFSTDDRDEGKRAAGNRRKASGNDAHQKADVLGTAHTIAKMIDQTTIATTVAPIPRTAPEIFSSLTNLPLRGSIANR